jgi:hypothetical protein
MVNPEPLLRKKPRQRIDSIDSIDPQLWRRTKKQMFTKAAEIRQKIGK